MSQPTCLSFSPSDGSRDAASVVFDLPGYRVLDAVDLPLGGRRIRVTAVDRDEGCPGCGTVSSRVHTWVEQRVKDIPFGTSELEVVVRKPRLVCAEQACSRRTFTQVTEQLPLRARCLRRLREALAHAVLVSGRAVNETAAGFGVAWWTVQASIDLAVVTLPEVDNIAVTQLGIDEHRFGRVRYFRDAGSRWRRVEPWMTTFVNGQNTQVLGIIDGRDTAGVRGWLEQRSPTWRDRVEVVSIDPSAAFRNAITAVLPNAKVSVDHWHLVRKANQMVTDVRQRVARERHGHRGRKDDLAWAHRMLLLRAGNRLTPAARDRLARVFADDRTGQIRAAWRVKEALRQLMATNDLDDAATAQSMLQRLVLAADMTETTRLWGTINDWWPEIETFLTTRATNARTEAANTTIKHIKRTGRGYRNHRHYQGRILLHSSRRTRRRQRSTQPGTTVNRE